ncbi:conserved hypothetical protein [Neospora caninum Liverpool]|uniref:Uncharacterized protein n=1 Tax=Neospora caninum (strain Liverpool) TaxID=572307 RepID=F0VJ42_NEOCL|nr:conserved hypothetical protein [Neospora caninum Liverpool]CBZ53753.1 conserved hypothetical protein [Neospora caninum Liverpool]|eukprot:XP_003883785.1 conserved hypothetical protein [Neospora caninum Liverpool]
MADSRIFFGEATPEPETLHDAEAGLLSSPESATQALRAALDVAGLELTARSRKALARLARSSSLQQWEHALRTVNLRLRGLGKGGVHSRKQKDKSLSASPASSSPPLSPTDSSVSGSEPPASPEHHVTVRTSEAVKRLMHALETHALTVDFVWTVDKEPSSREKLKQSVLFQGPEESSYQLARAEEIKAETEGKQEQQGQPSRVEGALLIFKHIDEGNHTDEQGITLMLRHSTSHTKALPDLAGTCRVVRRVFTLFVRRFSFPQPRTTLSLSFLKLAPDVTLPKDIDEAVIYPEDHVQTRWTVQSVLEREGEGEAAELKGLHVRELGEIKKQCLLLPLQFHSQQS